MAKVVIPFQSSDKSSTATLTYELFTNPVANRWRALVDKMQNFGLGYLTEVGFYGPNNETLEVIVNRITSALETIQERFPLIWREKEFESLRESPFVANQELLNVAHELFERVSPFMPLLGEQPLNKIVQGLNTDIHQLETRMRVEEGFVVISRFESEFHMALHKDDNEFFSADRLWGQLYLDYCHIGQSPLDSFYSNYSGTPLNQTEGSANFILQFQTDMKFTKHAELQQWLGLKLRKQIDLKDIPLGLVPLGKLCGDWTPESIGKFFEQYPLMGFHVEFQS